MELLREKLSPFLTFSSRFKKIGSCPDTNILILILLSYSAFSIPLILNLFILILNLSKDS